MSGVVEITLTEGNAKILLEVVKAHKAKGEYWGKKINHYVALDSLINAFEKALDKEAQPDE